MSAKPAEVRASRSFLRSNLAAGSAEISPRKFANAAKETGMSFSDLAGFLGRLYADGQGDAFYREQAIEQDLKQGGKN